MRYIVRKIGRLSLQLAKTARNDIINSIRENKLRIEIMECVGEMRLTSEIVVCENKFSRSRICVTY